MKNLQFNPYQHDTGWLDQHKAGWLDLNGLNPPLSRPVMRG